MEEGTMRYFVEAGVAHTDQAAPTEIPPRVKQNTRCRNDKACAASVRQSTSCGLSFIPLPAYIRQLRTVV
jgi:hypothetical protein